MRFMKNILFLILLLAILPAAALAQWSTNLNFGWLGNASPNWIESDHIGDEKPFSLWESGWQVGGGLEYRAKDWLAYGVFGSYQIFGTEPSGHYYPPISDGFSYTWIGQSSWQAPVSGYIRLIRPRAIMGTNLKLGLGVMASHVGQLTVITEGGFTGDFNDTVTVSGTGETIYRPYGQIGVGIKVPITARFGITVDYSYLSTFDRRVAETPLVVGLEVGW